MQHKNRAKNIIRRTIMFNTALFATAMALIFVSTHAGQSVINASNEKIDSNGNTMVMISTNEDVFKTISENAYKTEGDTPTTKSSLEKASEHNATTYKKYSVKKDYLIPIKPVYEEVTDENGPLMGTDEIPEDMIAEEPAQDESEELEELEIDYDGYTDADYGLYLNPTLYPDWDSSHHLVSGAMGGGTYNGPSGKETYYNLDMSGVIKIMRNMGFDEATYPYWERDDGCKMLGDYIMVAANLDLRPRGSLLETSLGMGLVCDTSSAFVGERLHQVDVAVTW